MAIGGTSIRSREERAGMVRDDLAYAERMAQSYLDELEYRRLNKREPGDSESLAEYWNVKAAEYRAELAELTN